MPSWQSQLFNFTARNRHLLRLRLRRDSWDEHTSVPRFREECERYAQRAKIPHGIGVQPVTIAGLRAEWILPPQAAPSEGISMGAGKDGVIFYVHGGGFISGSCSDHRAYVAKFVSGTGVGALQFEYRLAPEHPYPAAIEDSLAAYRCLLAEGVSPSKIVVAGESAGGGLTLALLLVLRDQGIPLPAAAVAISPLTDFKFTGESHRSRARVCVSPPGMNAVCGKYYVGEHDPGLPYISPLYGDLHGLPPLLIYVGDDETLRDDSIRFAEKAKAAGAEVALRVEKGMVHCYPLLPDFIPESKQAMTRICDFIQRRALAHSPV